jgi:drug/metabolite transporter (DMT)-like permease
VSTDNPNSRWDNRALLGGLMVLVSALMFAAIGALVKFVSVSLSTEMTVFARNAMALFFFLPWLFARAGLRGLGTTRWPLHLLRSAAGLGAMYCFYHALGRLRLADAVLLHYTAPLFIPILARHWLGEPIAPRVKGAVAAGFVGIVLILKPGFGIFQAAGLIGLASGVLTAVAMTTIRRLSATEPTARIIFYFTTLSSMASSVPLAWAWETPAPGLLGALVAMGLLAIAAQFFMTKGYSLAPAGQLAPFGFGNVVFAALLGWLIWGETLDGVTLIGAVLTCSAGVIATYQGGRPAGPQVPPG